MFGFVGDNYFHCVEKEEAGDDSKEPLSHTMHKCHIVNTDNFVIFF